MLGEVDEMPALELVEVQKEAGETSALLAGDK